MAVMSKRWSREDVCSGQKKKTETKPLESPRNRKENNVEQIIAAVKKSRQRFDLPAMLWSISHQEERGAILRAG